MKILYLHQYFNTPDRAGSTRSYEMARHLVRAGHEVHMITSDMRGGSKSWRRSQEAGIQVHWFPVEYSNRMPNRKRIEAFIRFAAGASQRASEIGGDLVFATSTPLTIALPAVYAALRCNLPMVFEVRDLWPEVPIAMGELGGWLPVRAAKELERFAYAHANHLVTLSSDMASGVANRGVPWDRISIIPNTADRELFSVSPAAGEQYRSRFEWLGNRPLVVYAGTMGRVNGVSYLVRLAAELRKRRPDIRFLIVGGGREESLVKALASQLGVLGSNLFFEDSIPKQELPNLLAAATVATSTVIDVPALWANSANKVFDGLAAGRPVIINHEGWMAELIRQTGCGLVLPPKDMKAAASILARHLGDKKWESKASKAASRAALQHFDRVRSTHHLERILKRVHHEYRESGQATQDQGKIRYLPSLVERSLRYPFGIRSLRAG